VIFDDVRCSRPDENAERYQFFAQGLGDPSIVVVPNVNGVRESWWPGQGNESNYDESQMLLLSNTESNEPRAFAGLSDTFMSMGTLCREFAYDVSIGFSPSVANGGLVIAVRQRCRL